MMVMVMVSLFLPDVDFGYSKQPFLFKDLDFGIDMSSRGNYSKHTHLFCV